MIPLVSQNPKAVDRIMKQRWLLNKIIHHDITLNHVEFFAVVSITKVAVSNMEHLFQVGNRGNKDVSDDRPAPNARRK